MTNSVENAVRQASERWKGFFNSGDAAGCASCYEESATMVAKPFGTFTGRESIQAFWQNLIDGGYAEVAYVDPKITVNDETSAVLASDWTMNKARGFITYELWVRQNDGSMKLREDHFEAQD